MQIRLDEIDYAASLGGIYGTRFEYLENPLLTKHMKEYGQIIPIRVINMGGRYVITSGFLRYLSAKRLGWEMLEAEIDTA